MGRKVGDYPLNELRKYRPELTNKPSDFQMFWDNEKKEISTFTPDVAVNWRDYAVPTVDVADLTFTSWDETPLKGLFVKPKGVTECPAIFFFHGYTGSRGFATNFLKWTTLGIAVVSFDVRGQGDSPDYGKYENGSRILGWMLNGIHDPKNYYFTNVYRDILMQLNWVWSNSFPIQPTRFGVIGGSQGGGLALTAAGLDGNVDFVAADWPFIAHFERALEVALSGPYMEIVNYFKWHDPQYEAYENVLKTLGYIDSVHFCDRITCPTLMGVGLEDAITPPSTVFAAYNHLAAKDKNIEVYPQFVHEANMFHEEKKIAFIAKQING
ncbi:acetylxylan esterase [Terrihalobacillus insolitus]|uniref:acetylxylan esterase n=1 Tax=Terrihalobacillus insolitus TaxID=2950438 RepID=UPI002340A254|nr:alpha/beta fold hydrolase [Terrihalobacillus insolitus]MDC3412176.1 acetylxylan esterase [Terrihalobacillus insolitus]